MDPVLWSAADALDTLAAEWRALVARDPGASIFHTPEYVRAWLAEFGDGRDARLVEMRRDGAVAGVAAVSLDPDGVLRFLGDQETTDYLGPVSAPADREQAAQALVEAISRVEGWSVCELHGLAADTGWPDAIARAAKEAGLEVEDQQQEVCPRVALAGTFDDYLVALPGKLRHEIRRKARRLERERGSYVVRNADAATLDADLATFYEMHRSSNGPKGKFLHEGMASFFSRLARETLAAGWLRLSMLEIAGRAVAGCLAFSMGGTWSVYNSAFDHASGAVAPGMVLLAETIRLATKEGCATFDLLRGSEAYKYRFGASDVPLLELRIRRG